MVVVGHAPALDRSLAESLGGEVLENSSFATATWTLPNGEAVDLVTARRESYASPAALPEVVPGSLEEDLQRRDFTVLAMAIDLDNGDLLDPAQGRQDLDLGLIRVQHSRSFVDDPTRVWRAARWGTRLGFSPAPETRAAMALARQLQAHEALGIERLGQEVHRSLADGGAERLFGTLHAWGWLQDIHPRLDGELVQALARAQEQTWHTHILAGREPYEMAEAGWLCLARHLPRTDREARVRLVPGGGDRWSLWREGPEQVEAALAALQLPPDRCALGLALKDRGCAIRAEVGAHLDPAWKPEMDWWEDHGRHIRCAVDGHLLQDAGVSPGPALGRGLQAALEAAWRGADPDGQLQAALATART